MIPSGIPEAKTPFKMSQITSAIRVAASITLCGLADIPIDTFSGETFVDCPFAVTFRADGSGFTYYDVITGPPGDAETVVNGDVSIH